MEQCCHLMGLNEYSYASARTGVTDWMWLIQKKTKNKAAEQCGPANTIVASFQMTTKPVSRSLKLERGHSILSFRIREDQREIKTDSTHCEVPLPSNKNPHSPLTPNVHLPLLFTSRVWLIPSEWKNKWLIDPSPVLAAGAWSFKQIHFMDVSESCAPVCAVIKRRLYRQIEDVDWCPCVRRVCVGVWEWESSWCCSACGGLGGKGHEIILSAQQEAT